MKKNKIVIIILTTLFTVSLVLGSFGFYVYTNKDYFNYNNDNDVNSDNDNIDDTQDIVSTISNMDEAKKVISIYKNKYSDIEVYTVEGDEDNYYEDDDNYLLIGEYGCKQEDCKAYSFYNNAESNILVEDDMYYIYDYNSKVTRKLNMEINNYENIRQVIYNNKLYGYIFIGIEDELVSYYSLIRKEEYTFDKYYTSYKNYYIFKDDNKYVEFNFIDDTANMLPLENKEYIYIDFVDYLDKLYGYIYGETNDKVSFYSIKDKKVTLKDIPANLEEGSPLAYGPHASLINGNIILNNILYNYSTGKVIHDFNPQLLPVEHGEGFSSISSLGNEKAMYYLASNVYNVDEDEVYVFNENFELMLNGQRFIMCDVTEDGNLIVIDKSDETLTTYKIYDKEGKLLFTSKKYKEIVSLSNGYISLVDTDNYLKILDYNGTLVTKIVKITDNLYIHTLLSGYYDYKGIRGIYIVVEDSNIKTNSDAGYGYEYYYDIDTKKVGKISTEIGGYAKPVLYLYPTTKTNVSVKFSKPRLLTTTYPKYKSSWNVIAFPNGDLYDKENKYYYGLYWEETGTIDVNFDRGFYVTDKNAIEFLESKLTEIGLNSKERNEFIMYWLPILEKNKKNLVYFEFTESRQKYNELIINPKPDSMLRFAIHIKKVDKEVKVKEQNIPKFERKGFAVIEWGGVIH